MIWKSGQNNVLSWYQKLNIFKVRIGPFKGLKKDVRYTYDYDLNRIVIRHDIRRWRNLFDVRYEYDSDVNTIVIWHDIQRWRSLSLVFIQDNIMMQIGFKNHVRIKSEYGFSSWKYIRYESLHMKGDLSDVRYKHDYDVNRIVIRHNIRR